MKKCPNCGTEYKDSSTLCPVDGAVLMKEGDALIGTTLAGKYRVDSILSEGGMGTVYRGTHILMDKTVAIKVLHPALAADSVIVARFSREARAASRISHPHAISVTDFGESEAGIVFLVMEFLNGRTLKEVIKSEVPLALPRVVEIMRQICGALEAAHAENVVHRDLKSDNIMLLDVAEGDWVKVLDFGIAKIQEPAGKDPGLTTPNLIIGTPHYMSPEQCSKSSEIDARSDIYSLGVILYEMLSGHVPFTGESPTAIMMKHLQDEPPDILTVRGDLPLKVSMVVARALAKRPEDRFQSVQELKKSLALAAADSTAPAVLSGAVGTNERHSNRIVVPTVAHGDLDEFGESDDDEITVVHSNPIRSEPDALVMPPPPPRPRSDSSWKIAAFALLGVIIIGGVLFAMTRNRQAATDQTPVLTADPNSQPVKPSAPPTGQAEQGIAPNSAAGSSDLGVNTNSNTSNTNDNTGLPPDTPPIDGNSNTQGNTNTSGSNNQPGSNSNANGNSNTAGGSPSPKPSVKVDVGTPPPLPSPKSSQ